MGCNAFSGLYNHYANDKRLMLPKDPITEEQLTLELNDSRIKKLIQDDINILRDKLNDKSRYVYQKETDGPPPSWDNEPDKGISPVAQFEDDDVDESDGDELDDDDGFSPVAKDTGILLKQRRLFAAPTLAERSIDHDSITTSEIVAALGLSAIGVIFVRRFLRKRETEPHGY